MFCKSKLFVHVTHTFDCDFSVAIHLLTSSKSNSDDRMIVGKIATKHLPFFRFFHFPSKGTKIRFTFEGNQSIYDVASLLPFRKIYINEHLSITVSKESSGATFVCWNGKIPKILASSFLYLRCPFCVSDGYFSTFQDIGQLEVHLHLFHGDHFCFELLHQDASIFLYDIKENRAPLSIARSLSQIFTIRMEDHSLAPRPFSFKYKRKKVNLPEPMHKVSPKMATLPRKIYHGQERYFVDSFLMQPLNLLAVHSSPATENTETIIHDALIQDFCDLTPEEKSIMIGWNHFQRQM